MVIHAEEQGFSVVRVKIDDMALMNYFRFGDNDDYQFVGANKDSDFYEVELGTQKLYSYKMTHDNRFAPNPLFGVLTLATCKPRMRQNMHVGEWIAGWTSKSIAHSPTEVGEEKLIYLAKVTKKLTIAEYWEQYTCRNATVIISMNRLAMALSGKCPTCTTARTKWLKMWVESTYWCARSSIISVACRRLRYRLNFVPMSPRYNLLMGKLPKMPRRSSTT